MDTRIIVQLYLIAVQEEEDPPNQLVLKEQQMQHPYSTANSSSSSSGLSIADNMNSWRDETLNSSTEDQEMALQFSRWFYPMLNACNPLCAGASQESFGVQHFFRDCSMCILSIVGSPCPQNESYTGAELVTDRLKSLVQIEQIIFNPNLEPSGVRGIQTALII